MKDKVKLMREYDLEQRELERKHLKVINDLMGMLQDLLDDYVECGNICVSREYYYKVGYDDNNGLHFRCDCVDDNLITFLRNDGFCLTVFSEDALLVCLS